MALIKCKECGSEVSSKAETCPKCGSRVAAKPMGCGALIGIIFLGGIIISSVSSIFSSASPPIITASKTPTSTSQSAATVSPYVTQTEQINNDPVKLKDYNAKLAAEKKQVAKDEKRAKVEAKKAGVHVGMTQEQVLGSSWGKPDKINTTTNRFGEHAQWVYRSRGTGYLYFENGILTSIQN